MERAASGSEFGAICLRQGEFSSPEAIHASLAVGDSSLR